MRRLPDKRIGDFLRAFEVLSARYPKGKQTWSLNGDSALINVRRLPDRVDKLIHKVTKQYFDKTQYPITMKHVKVYENWNRFWTIQRNLTPSHFRYLLRRAHEWHTWGTGRAPCLLKWHGRLIIWNGTHRTIISYMLHRPLWARVIDLDRYERDKKKGRV